MLARRLARHIVDFLVMSEDTPNPDSRVRPWGEDGAEVIYRPGDRNAHERFVQHMRALLKRNGFPVVLGHSFAMPTGENPTVAMIEAAYRHHGLNWRYINCEVRPKNLKDAVAGARALGWVQLLHSPQGRGDPASGRAGPVRGDHRGGHTIIRRGDRLIGESTDGKGFVKALSQVIDPAGKKVMLFGAGGRR